MGNTALILAMPTAVVFCSISATFSMDEAPVWRRLYRDHDSELFVLRLLP